MSGALTIDDDAWYTAAEVAQLVFNRVPGWLTKHKKALTAEHGFPRPISPIGLPHWRGADLNAWIARDKTVDAPRPASNIVSFTLRERAKALARKPAHAQ